MDRYYSLFEQIPHWVVSGGGWIWIVGLVMIVIAFRAYKRR